MIEEYVGTHVELETVIAAHNASTFDDVTGEFTCSCHGRGRIRWVMLAWR